MRFSHFFIDRPIFAAVLSIVLVIAGLVAMAGLPITLYPPIAPPTVQVSVVYPGTSAEVVANTVAAERVDPVSVQAPACGLETCPV